LRFGQIDESNTVKLKKFVLNTMSESSDHYVYFIEHFRKPTRQELEKFLSVYACDKDDEGCYEYVQTIEEIKENKFKKIP